MKIRFFALILVLVFFLSACNTHDDVFDTTDNVIDTENADDTEIPSDADTLETTADKTDKEEPAVEEEKEVLVGTRILSPLFQSHMVLQRDKEIKIFGTGQGEGSVTLGTVTKPISTKNNKNYLRFPNLG